MIRRFCSIAISLSAAVFFSSLQVAAQQADKQAPTDKQIIEQLLRRLAEDEGRLLSLEARLGAAASGVATSGTAALAAPSPSDPSAAVALASMANMAAAMNHSGHDSPMGSGPGLQLRGFGDFTYKATDQGGSTNGFTLGQFDLFMTSKLSEHWNFLAESVIQADKATNSFGFEIERMLVTYK